MINLGSILEKLSWDPWNLMKNWWENKNKAGKMCYRLCSRIIERLKFCGELCLLKLEGEIKKAYKWGQKNFKVIFILNFVFFHCNQVKFV